MIKKTIISVCGSVLAVALSFPAAASQSIGFQHYLKEGIRAHRAHDEEKAFRYFELAHIYHPDDPQVNQYLAVLQQEGFTLVSNPSGPPEQSIGYQYYLGEGIRAYQEDDYKQAVRYFRLAKIFYPDSKEAGRYLDILGRINLKPVQQPTEVISMQPSASPTVEPIESNPPQAVAPVKTPITSSQTQAPVQTQGQSPSQPPPAVSKTPVREALYVGSPNTKAPPVVLSLAQLTNNGVSKPHIQIQYHATVILEGRNIQRFLLVDEGFITVKQVDPNHLELYGRGIGSTFLHIWDATGRNTLYVEVVFPKPVLSRAQIEAASGIEHSQPFVFTYANDWNSYYQGKNASALKRQSFEFTNSLGVTGETPYGLFDAYGSYSDFDSFTEFDTYTIGLSQIPLRGTSNFNIRGFDALRYNSALVMPQTRLRGVFVDVDLFNDFLGVSFSHGQEQAPLGFISAGQSSFSNEYIDALRLTLLPRDANDHYSFNFATGYGPDRQPYLSNHVYSVEGLHKFNDFLSFSAEQAYDSSHDATLASLRWENTAFKTGLHFRNIDKNYSTISALPAYQGETGLVWESDGIFNNITEDTFLEAYRDRLDANPNDSSAYNYDGNGHLRVDLTDDVWTDSELNFVDTPGELSPNSSVGLNQRISRRFGIWNGLHGTVFAGAGYQTTNSSQSDLTNYDRDELIGGIALPITRQIGAYANYEYDWLHQQAFGNSTPSVVNAGINYQKQVNAKFSITSQADYHNELGVKSSNNSFLSGEESIIMGAGFNYTPTPDINLFGDADVSRVLSHIGNPAYDDFEVHLGVRITFGGVTYWDPVGTVSGVVFKDRRQKGKFMKGDEGIPGVKIKVGDKEVTTDKYGRYRIQFRARGVAVTPVLDSVPGGLIFSTPQTLDVRILQGRTVHADFGLISKTGIFGIVFLSKDNTNTPSPGDKFIDKVRVVLDGKESQKTDAHGTFYFRDVQPGEHTISIDINSLAIDMVPLIKLKNKIDVAEGTNYAFNIPVQIRKAEGQPE